MACSSCGGSGKHGPGADQWCRYCDGTGDSSNVACPACDGSGKRDNGRGMRKDCYNCGGSGRTSR